MNKLSKRVAGAAALGAAAVIGITSLGVGSASAAPVPGGQTTKTLVDGTSVKISLFDHTADIQRPITNIPTSREVWVSGKVRVNVGGAAEGGKIKVGYDVGCQVNFGTLGLDVPGIAGNTTEGITSPSEESSVGAGVSLGPGQVKRVWLINDTNADDKDVNDYSFSGSAGGTVYSQEAFRVDSCAGYAAARPVIAVTVDTDNVTGIVTYNGPQFSLG